MNEFEAHESSYDHQHKKRLKETKDLQRQIQNSTRKEEKGPLMSIKLGSTTSKTTGGFKKGGFKNAFGPVEESAIKSEAPDTSIADVTPAGNEEDNDSDLTDQEDYYDPTRPTGCHPNCPGISTATTPA